MAIGIPLQSLVNGDHGIPLQSLEKGDRYGMLVKIDRTGMEVQCMTSSYSVLEIYVTVIVQYKSNLYSTSELNDSIDHNLKSILIEQKVK